MTIPPYLTNLMINYKTTGSTDLEISGSLLSFQTNTRLIFVNTSWEYKERSVSKSLPYYSQTFYYSNKIQRSELKLGCCPLIGLFLTFDRHFEKKRKWDSYQIHYLAQSILLNGDYFRKLLIVSSCLKLIQIAVIAASKCEKNTPIAKSSHNRPITTIRFLWTSKLWVCWELSMLNWSRFIPAC